MIFLFSSPWLELELELELEVTRGVIYEAAGRDQSWSVSRLVKSDQFFKITRLTRPGLTGEEEKHIYNANS